VGRVTRPVTQVDVVAVNSASMNDTDTPSAQLIGRAKSRLPRSIVIMKLIRIICVVESENFLFIAQNL
jgi:hypothetical protein